MESKTRLLNVEKYEKMAMAVATAGSHSNTKGGRGRGSQLNRELALQSMTSGDNKSSQPSYDKMATAAAYAVARLPGCYAALYRVFEEISRLRPSWKPASVLDFGAGPATATWAAREVWPDVKLRVSCVEQSPQMVNMGMLIANQIHDNEPHYGYNNSSSSSSSNREEEKGGEENGYKEEEDEEEDKAPPAPSIRWVQHLGGPNTRGRKVGGVSDLVVAAYVLGELRSDSERQRVVKKLWDRTKGMLVLIEPGTPSGSMNIMKARHEILGITPLDEYSAPGRGRAGGGEGEDGKDGSSSLNVDCHVVAPCPHDGRCPLEGRRSWCHFATKYKRPYFQRIMGGPPSDGTGVGPSLLGGYTTEKFSYVVLERGERGRMRGDEGENENEEEDGSLMMMNDVSIEDSTLHNGTDNEGGEEEGISEDDRMELMSGEEEDDEKEGDGIDKEALKAAQMASTSWSRLLRPPQTRKGHVLLDICSAQEGFQGRKGSLIRQIVSKGGSKKALGGSTGAYRMARKAAWGDLWPGYYQKKMVNSREPPPTAKKEF
jgi:ribosomal protein RSM22 (predicted rRNA methylase)